MLTIPKRRIYVSAPLDQHLDADQLALKRAILKLLEDRGFEPQEFLARGIAKRKSWSFENAAELMSKCEGALILAFTRWQFKTHDQIILMPSEYSHFEGALALAGDLPTWIVAEEGVMNRGIVWTGGGMPITYVNTGLGAASLSDPSCHDAFLIWCQEIEARPRVFFGYCSQARSTANDIHLYVERHLGVAVRNYAMDFQAGGTILGEIERAARDCSCGIFLFTKDDPLTSSVSGQAAPRDNVVFEAGFFMHAKGKERTLIIREEGAKMPADIGGNIYISLKDRSDVSTIHTELGKFLADRL